MIAHQAAAKPGIRKGRLVPIAGACALLACSIAPARADAVSDFYTGKQLSFIVPTPPGGSYDGYGRLLSRYIGKYIPGRPTIVASNMAGAGGIVGAQHVAAIAPKDGTVLTVVSQGLLLLAAGTGLLLQLNGGSDLPVTASGKFNIGSALPSGTAYSVTVKTQPVSQPAQTCTVNPDGAGTLTTADITSVVISCANLPGRFVYVANNSAGSSAGMPSMIEPRDFSTTFCASQLALSSSTLSKRADPNTWGWRSRSLLRWWSSSKTM